jgi:hypothetical protein
MPRRGSTLERGRVAPARLGEIAVLVSSARCTIANRGLVEGAERAVAHDGLVRNLDERPADRA